uniref:Uncharacterized protein n=2 Tax=Neisseria meningitidis TaxID=487 RepID=I4E2S8_NEIME|nr:hypothetical protein predicted by Glimmer/Critica [Neisseria meningitidis alpha153]CCA43640.1 hypothetical protein NMALPHA522_0099 [Neisseria meningitidis alpha522]
MLIHYKSSLKQCRLKRKSVSDGIVTFKRRAVYLNL